MEDSQLMEGPSSFHLCKAGVLKESETSISSNLFPAHFDMMSKCLFFKANVFSNYWLRTLFLNPVHTRLTLMFQHYVKTESPLSY